MNHTAANLSAALKLATAGISVLPALISWSGKKLDKKPLVTDWPNAATTDAEQIRKWWTESPDAVPGIGVAQAGLVVIDLDRHKDAPDGVKAFEELKGRRRLNEPPMTRTPSGGFHLYFRQPSGEPLGDGKGALPLGIDVKGKGFVVAPGAICDCGRWQDVRREPLTKAFRAGAIPPLPEWLASIIRAPRSEPRSSIPTPELSPTNRPQPGKREAKYAAAALANISTELARAQSGTRNNSLNTAAFKMATMIARAWIDKPTVADALWKSCELNGLVHDDSANAVQKTLASGFDAGMEEPHEDLPDREPDSARTAHVEKRPSDPPKPNGGGQQVRQETPDPAWPDVEEKTGRLRRTYRNARAAIQALGITCSYDEFHDVMKIGGHTIGVWAGQLSDAACCVLRQAIIDKYDFDPGKDNVNEAAVELCIENRFDPVVDYLDGLKWDGLERLDKWMVTYLGAADTPLNRAIAKLTLVAAVRRARQPGCKFDHMLVLEGPEARLKSTTILTLAGSDENFSDQTILTAGDREQQELVAGKWFMEIPELAGMRKAEIEKTKAFITRTHDRARGAYRRYRSDAPRRCIFIGTTNDDSYLKSQTGNRRFWPVQIGVINIDALRRDRDQLFAEAAAVEAAGMPLVLPEELWTDARVEQEKRLEPDMWDDMLANAAGTIYPATDGSPALEVT